jgi:hypothetical protein
MAPLRDKLQNALDECRMLILAGEVLLSFTSEAVLQPGFTDLGRAARVLCAAGMLALVVSIGLLMAPAAYHRLACRGDDRPSLLRFTTRAACAALAPFALALAFTAYVAGERTVGVVPGAIAGAAVGAGALSAWYILPAARRPPGVVPPTDTMDEVPMNTSLEDKIHQVLTEARMVLPGAQALLGFGTIAVLTSRFDALPRELKLVHAGGLLAIAAAVVLLMTPAAFHRIAERGEPSERFHRLASRLLLGAMAALALGMAAAVWLVVQVVFESRAAGAATATGVVLAFYTLWFVWPMSQRRPPGSDTRGPAI